MSEQPTTCWACGARQQPTPETSAEQVDDIETAVATWQWLFGPTTSVTGDAR